MSGSFHLSFFAFRQFWQPSYENQLSLSGKDSAADFFVFGHFDQNTKNEKCNEPDIRRQNIFFYSHKQIIRTIVRFITFFVFWSK